MTSKIDMKIVLLGKEYGGKTSLVERFLHDRFSGDIPYQNVSFDSRWMNKLFGC
jgi:Ras-related protein Rab-24